MKGMSKHVSPSQKAEPKLRIGADGILKMAPELPG